MNPILKRFPELKPFEKDLDLRMQRLADKEKELLPSGGSLKDFSNAHLYYGFHRTADGWVYREWAPGADRLYLTGDFNSWHWLDTPLTPCGNGNWEVFLPGETLHAGSLVRTITDKGGSLTEHIPAYARRVVQDPNTFTWTCEITEDRSPFVWTDSGFRPDKRVLIYEAHVGMSSEEAKMNTYLDFADNVLPRIKADGYTTVQLMAIMEHPYYGSFGYQVSSFYAASSWFGYPDDLRYLVNKAHSLGLRVLLDLVHSHAVKNTLEGLNLFDGTEDQYFHAGSRGDHAAWGTKLFNYDKPEVLHFLLSNLKFWLEEYHFDGFRFDGVTSMLYHDHGLGASFDNLSMYFTMNTDVEAVTYLQLANKLIRQVKPDAVTIAEDMSGMPGMAVPVEEGGLGFDYRLAMGQPDMWIRMIKTQRDEDWSVGRIYHELTNRNVPTVAYTESHDQALVGDQTIMFRLAGAEMYTSMDIFNSSPVIARAVALHKMLRLVTISAGGDAYLNFMGNEFGHPEWIDFPREGNGYSSWYARRQWSLSTNPVLKYKDLLKFDNDMIRMVRTYDILSKQYPTRLYFHESEHVMAYERCGLVFVFNFDPVRAYENYRIPVPAGEDYELVLCTDDSCYGGYGRIARQPYSAWDPAGNALHLYLPARTALVLRPQSLKESVRL